MYLGNTKIKILNYFVYKTFKITIINFKDDKTIFRFILKEGKH